ncbi:MAG: hypothetical protein ACTSSM_06680 [Promethearchaeota archaeon]
MSNASKNRCQSYDHLFLTKTRIKKHVHLNGLEISNEVFQTLNKKFQALLNESIERAKRNYRKRLLARDV